MNPSGIANYLSILGIQLRAEGQELVLSGPCHRLTDELRAGIREHKQALFVLLQPPDIGDSTFEFGLNAIPIGKIDAWRSAIEPPDPCEQCGGLELWESMAGDLDGLAPGIWRCLRCESPVTARRIGKLVARLKRTAVMRPRHAKTQRGVTANP